MMNFKVKVEKETPQGALVVVEPLEAGYGHTLGNSLRRAMLSSLSGSAITAVKIDGVQHQFSTVPGVKESVIEILLNLKKVRVKLYSEDGKSAKFVLKKSGGGKVTAGDIDTQGLGEVVNKDAHIATLSDAKAKLGMELIVERGVGYSSSDERKSEEIGLIATDALFSPVRSVNYTVESTRVGRRTDLDKLNLEIITDGTISALDAVLEVAKILQAAFGQIVNPIEDIEPEVSETSSVFTQEILKATVEELDLPVRITNALRAIEVNIVEDLVNVPRVQLVKAKNLGAKSISLISEKLAERGLNLRET